MLHIRVKAGHEVVVDGSPFFVVKPTTLKFPEPTDVVVRDLSGAVVKQFFKEQAT